MNYYGPSDCTVCSLISAVFFICNKAHEKKINIATGEAKQKKKKKKNPLISHNHLSACNAATLTLIFLNKQVQRLASMAHQTPKINTFFFLQKEKKLSQTVINMMKGTVRPGQYSVYFHQTSTLVCVMTTFSERKKENW